MKLTVAICTWNRARLLRQTLEKMTSLVIPGGVTWELLVVDNASTDETRNVVRSFEGTLPLQYIHEGRQGKTHAANTAVATASGEAILWLDDDVLVGSGWLAAYVYALEKAPDVGVFGGPIRPRFEGTPPQWISKARKEVGPVYAELDLGSEPVALDGQRYPYGANMAIRKTLHDRVPFDTRVGRRGRSLMGASETVLIRELFRQGVAGRWVPEAGIEHIIPQDRQTLLYVRRFYFGAGKVMSVVGESGGPRLMGRPRWVWRQAVQAEVLFWLTRPWAHPRRWLKHLADSGFAWGMIRGAPKGG